MNIRWKLRKWLFGKSYGHIIVKVDSECEATEDATFQVLPFLPTGVQHDRNERTSEHDKG